MSTLLARCAQAVHRFAPGLKRLLPKPLQRLVLLHLLGGKRLNAEVAGQPNRLCLEEEILPRLAAQNLTVLFVGTGSYTFRYEHRYRWKHYTTIDANPGQAVWGARDHIVAPVEEIGRHRPAGSFDGVVLNGVFGFGVNDPAAMRRAAQALHDVLRPGGTLVVGWNDDMTEDPETLGVFAPLFRRTPEPRRTFPGGTHVYDFYVRQ